MALPFIILLVFCVALPTCKSLAVGIHAGGYVRYEPLHLRATDGEEHIDAVQVDDKDVFTNNIPDKMKQLVMALEVVASRLEKHQLNMDLLMDRIEQIVHDRYGQHDTGEPADQIQRQWEPSARYQHIEINPQGQDKTGNENEAVDTGSDASSLVTDVTNDHTEPNHSDQREVVTANVPEVDQEWPTQQVKGGQDLSGMGQQQQGTSHVHPTAQSQSPRQQLPSSSPQQTYPAEQQDQLQNQLQTSQQQDQLQSKSQQQLLPQLQQQVEQSQQSKVGHEQDELDEIIDLASGLTNNHHAAVKPPAASRAFAMMRPITWEARRRTKISRDLEDFDLNLIDREGLPWLPIRK